jgi:hypothetical protein
MQQAIVALIVLAALVFAVWRFMPARWRQRLAARLGLGTAVANAGSCHACDDCSGCRPAGPPEESKAK